MGVKARGGKEMDIKQGPHVCELLPSQKHQYFLN